MEIEDFQDLVFSQKQDPDNFRRTLIRFRPNRERRTIVLSQLESHL
jgi:hypothetical protein